MTEPAALSGPQRLIRRIIAERRAGAPDEMIAKYAITEALHLITGHDGAAADCTRCHEAMARAVDDVRDLGDITGAAIVVEHDEPHRLTTPCDGESCEQGGAAHCHRCPEAETDNLLRDRDRWREGWRRACTFLADAGWNGDERWESLRAEVETAGTAPTALNLPAFAWGESVTWNQGRVLVPLNRDNETVADLVLDEDAAGTLAAMLDDAAGASDPTDWGEPGIQWTCGVRRPDGSTTTDTDAPPADDETAVRAYVERMQDSNGYRKALLRRDVSAWREVADA